jgi:hypothetical protein
MKPVLRTILRFPFTATSYNCGLQNVSMPHVKGRGTFASFLGALGLFKQEEGVQNSTSSFIIKKTGAHHVIRRWCRHRPRADRIPAGWAHLLRLLPGQARVHLSLHHTRVHHTRVHHPWVHHASRHSHWSLRKHLLLQLPLLARLRMDLLLCRHQPLLVLLCRVIPPQQSLEFWARVPPCRGSTSPADTASTHPPPLCLHIARHSR